MAQVATSSHPAVSVLQLHKGQSFKGAAHGFRKILGMEQEVNETPDPAEEMFVLRCVLSFTRLSTTLRLHVDHPAAWQETHFSHGFGHVFAGLLLLQLSCFPSWFVCLRSGH